MLEQELLASYKKTSSARIIFVVVDGLGGLKHPDFTNHSELEYANLPNLDSLVKRKETVLGLVYPVARGFIPGSAAGHFGLFGYDPLLNSNQVGRGILEALDTGTSVPSGAVVARLNLSTVSDDVVVDRRANRIEGTPFTERLNQLISLNGASATILGTQGHRGIVVLQDPTYALSADVTDTDPGDEGKPILRCRPRDEANPSACRTADLVNDLSEQARQILREEPVANSMLLRGFSENPSLRSLADLHGLEALAIADYPLYRGIAKMFGMTVCDPVPSLQAKVDQFRENYASYTFFYIHYKATDSKGEDKDFRGKVKALEDFDRVVPDILDVMDLKSDTMAITGDHSTPSLVGAHTHHPVPLLLYSGYPDHHDASSSFSELQCAGGTFGQIRGTELMGCLLARAGKLKKFDL